MRLNVQPCGLLRLRSVDRRRRKRMFESDYIVYRVTVGISSWLSRLSDADVVHDAEQLAR
jgi:hypothetical protein